MYKIGQIAKRAGMGVETVRYYEQIGVLPAAHRAQNGYRIYNEEHLRRLRFIKRARELGFSLEKVRSLLSLADDERMACRQVRAIAEQHLSEIRRNIADLQAMQRVLETAVAPCPGDNSRTCPILDALFADDEGG